MKTRFLFALKYAFFAFVAFTVPKMIVDSGRIVAPLEPSTTSASAPPPSTRSFWPFRFLQAAPSSPAVADASPSASPAERFNDAAPSRDYPASPYDVWRDDVRLNASASAADGARLDGSYFSAPLSSPDERSSFARFAESRFAPSSPSTSFASDATASPFFADSVSTPRRFEEFFRFGHSPAWLVENWPRVDAVATDDGLVGYRVAISTGDATDDLTGVFACYFDATSERRVEFSGQTGDYRRLLRFMRREYGVALSPDSTAERFCYESTLSDGRGGALPGRLVVRPTRVFLRGAEKSFFEIDVVLERPNNR